MSQSCMTLCIVYINCIKGTELKTQQRISKFYLIIHFVKHNVVTVLPFFVAYESSHNCHKQYGS